MTSLEGPWTHAPRQAPVPEIKMKLNFTRRMSQEMIAKNEQ